MNEIDKCRNKTFNKGCVICNDVEFYTRLKDIELELKDYPAEQFENKTVFCPCDGPTSAFRKYFSENFEDLGLAFLYCADIWTGEVYTKSKSGEKTEQVGYNSFDSVAGNSIYDMADFIITNPPFNQKEKFWKWLHKDASKKFLVILPEVSVLLTTFLPDIQAGNFWAGNHSVHKFIGQNGETRKAPCYWWTNMNLVRIPRKMENPKEPYVRQFDDTGKYLYIERLAYLKYEKNYTGMIRVPFTIAQFPDILKDYDILGNRKVHIAGKEKYTGFLIRRKNNGK